MGRMKEEFMQMRLEEQDQTYITMQEIAQEAKDIMEKHHPIGQERYVDEAEFERNEIIDSMRDEFMSIREQEDAENEYNSYMSERPEEQEQLEPSINQLNNKKMSKKTMQEKLKKQPEPIVETRKEALRRLYKENGLVEEDIYKDKRGFVIITRTGIDKIVSRNNITVAYEVITMDIEKGICVLRAAASMKVGNEVKNSMSFGEASEQ